VYLLDELGNTLSGDESSSLLDKFDSNAPATHWFEHRTGIYTAPNGVSYLYSSEVLSKAATKVDSPWIVLAMKPMDEVTAVARHAALALAAAALGMVLVAGP